MADFLSATPRQSRLSRDIGRPSKQAICSMEKKKKRPARPRTTTSDPAGQGRNEGPLKRLRRAYAKRKASAPAIRQHGTGRRRRLGLSWLSSRSAEAASRRNQPKVCGEKRKGHVSITIPLYPHIAAPASTAARSDTTTCRKRLQSCAGILR